LGDLVLAERRNGDKDGLRWDHSLERTGPASARQRFSELRLGKREDGLLSQTMLEQKGEGRKEFDPFGDGDATANQRN
jgi:hypothetical protein